MSDNEKSSSFVTTESKRLALEIISTLVYIKKEAAARILTPAGIPQELIQRFVSDKSDITGTKMTKREAATMVFDELDKTGEQTQAIREIIKLAAKWEDFHLANDEYKARSCVQKAREVEGMLAEITTREKAHFDERVARSRDETRQRIKDLVNQQSPLLLAQFEAAMIDADPHQRGYLLEHLFERLFTIHGFPVVSGFKRNNGGEQIDGAFEMESWHYLFECRWRERLTDTRQVDGLGGQVGRSGKQTMGLLLSISGWSGNVVPLLKQNPDKNIILMDGMDLHAVLSQQIGLRELLKAKLSALNLNAEPFFSVRDIIA